MGLCKKYVTCIMTFFTPFNSVILCQFCFNTFPVFFIKPEEETIQWEKRSFTLSRYIKGGKKSHFGTQLNFFRHTFCINNPHWQSGGTMIFLSKYFIVISAILVDTFLDMLLLFLAVMSSVLLEKPRRNKDWVTEKSTQKKLCEGHHFFDCTPSFLCHFLLLSSSTPSLFPSECSK